MGISDFSPFDLVQKLSEDPTSDDVLAELAQRIENPETEFTTRIALIEHLDGAHATPPSWSNCIGGQKCYPAAILRPKGLNDLLDAVKTAQSKSLTVRAVGSGHSFSNVCPTDGLLLDPHDMKHVLSVNSAVLKDPSSANGLVSVESGMTIVDFNNHLDLQGLALANMGAYDGQTLAGAISTGTHGTGVTLGPVASSVRALVLVASDGTVYQIEPSNGITDPAKFASSSNPSNVQLKQDDDWFNTTLVAMGCTGLIYSYIIAVVPSFNLQEFRTLHTWEDLKAGLSTGASSEVLTQNRGYEIDMNPYVDKSGKHACIQIVHKDTTSAASGDRGLMNFLAGIIANIPGAETVLVLILNALPRSTPNTITKALKSLVTPTKEKQGYIDKSFKVMNIGAGTNNLKAYAMELSMPCDENLVNNVDKLLGVLAEQAQLRKHPQFLAGPMALRFVAQSDAFLAPQANRVTCMVEMDTLVGVKTSETLLKDYVKTKMCTPGSGIRVHWGLDLDTVTKADVPDMYPDFPKWLAVYKQLNANGMWNNGFTDRIGISVPRK